MIHNEEYFAFRIHKRKKINKQYIRLFELQWRCEITRCFKIESDKKLRQRDISSSCLQLINELVLH